MEKAFAYEAIQNEEIYEQELTIPEDSFLLTSSYNDYVKFSNTGSLLTLRVISTRIVWSNGIQIHIMLICWLRIITSKRTSGPRPFRFMSEG